VVVDGGKGQLKMAVEALAELGRSDVAVVGLAKARTLGDFSDAEVETTAERFFIPGRQNPISFPVGSAAYQILVGLRDEAHRFAITFHRKVRGKESMASVLDTISGLGEKRKKVLLKHFPSVDEIRRATVDDLVKVTGFGRAMAERVLLHFSGGPEDAAADGAATEAVAGARAGSADGAAALVAGAGAGTGSGDEAGTGAVAEKDSDESLTRGSADEDAGEPSN
jgi:hypothetical protein